MKPHITSRSGFCGHRSQEPDVVDAVAACGVASMVGWMSAFTFGRAVGFPPRRPATFSRKGISSSRPGHVKQKSQVEVAVVDVCRVSPRQLDQSRHARFGTIGLMFQLAQPAASVPMQSICASDTGAKGEVYRARSSVRAFRAWSHE
jgi:hypothetical protein